MPLATEPFIDLSTIDLTRIAVDADEVGRLNPQAGEMRFLDHIIWMDEGCSICVGVHEVRDDEFWVEGHIPGRPLMPGVILIEAAAQASSVLFKKRCGVSQFIGFTRCDDAVFRGQVVPGDTLYLVAKERSFTRRRFITLAQGIVDDKVVFEVQITGMLM